MAKPPPRPGRQTMEVDISWLEDHLESKKSPQQPAPGEKKKKPPRMPGAAVTVPPLPVAPSPSERPGRKTIEVELDWVELVDENGNVVKKPVEKKEKSEKK